MPWLQVETELGHIEARQFELRLEELGALAIWLTDSGDDPVLEPAPGSAPLWKSTRIAALFPATADQPQIAAVLGELVGRESLHFADVADRDWTADWQRSLGPLRLGKTLYVIQGAEDVVPDDSVCIYLTPGLAFGTGEHPTTAMCVEWLADIGAALSGKTVLDYGCGSGLLAIAALKLGARRATAVDIDPQALLATTQNAELNKCLASIDVVSAEETPYQQHDVVVANILSNTLIECGSLLNRLTRPGGHIALSGVLTHQAEDVCGSWADWAALRVTSTTDDWVLLSGTKFKAMND